MRKILTEEHEGANGVLLKLVVAKTHAAKGDGKDAEAHELDGLAAPRVDEQERDPVTGDETSHRQDDVADRKVVQRLVLDELRCTRLDSAVADRRQDD